MIQLLGALLAIASNLPGHVNPWSTFIAFLLISFGYNLVITAGNAMIIDASMLKIVKLFLCWIIGRKTCQLF